MHTIAAGAPTVLNDVDQKGRTIYTLTQNFGASNWIRVLTAYDERGFETFVSQPYDPAAGESANLGTRYLGHDALGRLTDKEVDQTNGQILTTSYAHAGFTTTIVAGGITMSRTYNGLGQLVETVDGDSNATRYAYDGAGNPIVLQDPSMMLLTPPVGPGDVAIRARFNALGQKEWVEDPDWWNSGAGDYGRKTFTYNGLGEVLSETDPNGNLIEMHYDVLGRLTHRVVNGDLVGFWAYDSTDPYKGLGLLDYEDSQFQPDGSRLQRFFYYSLPASGRMDLLQVTHRFYENGDQNDFTDYDTAFFTDSFYARPKGLRYPGGTSLAFEYDNQGHLIEENDPLSSVVYRQITDRSSRFQIEAADIGFHNGSFQYSQTASYWQPTGQADTIVVSNGSTAVQDLGYSYDEFGNVETRSTYTGGTTTETLSYDNLQRLTQTDRSFAAGGNQTVSYGYDPSGNITSKSDYASLYSYDPYRPHVLTSVNRIAGGNLTLSFDNNGNMEQGDGEDISYNAFNKPVLIEEQGGTAQSTFTYGADLSRYRQTTPQGTTIYYLDKLMEIEVSASNADYRHYLSDVAILTKTGDLNDPNPGISYTLRDRLGSVATIADVTGLSTESRAYDPFGRPRNGDWTDRGTLGSSVTDRGFTDHEHLDDWQLIHMNGRGYDYNLGRFLSVDPIIANPASSQAANPYIYIGNNPLSGTDPTGYKAEDVEESEPDKKQVWAKVPGSRLKHIVGSATAVSNDEVSAELLPGYAGAGGAISYNVQRAKGNGGSSSTGASTAGAASSAQNEIGSQQEQSEAAPHSSNSTGSTDSGGLEESGDRSVLRQGEFMTPATNIRLGLGPNGRQIGERALRKALGEALQVLTSARAAGAGDGRAIGTAAIPSGSSGFNYSDPTTGTVFGYVTYGEGGGFGRTYANEAGALLIVILLGSEVNDSAASRGAPVHISRAYNTSADTGLPVALIAPRGARNSAIVIESLEGNPRVAAMATEVTFR